MGLSQLTGTSWHIETIHKKSGITTRHKNKCMFYDKGFCSKKLQNCYGSSSCYTYREKQIKVVENKNKDVYYKKNKKMIGTFSLKFDNKNIQIFTIGIDIRHDDPLVKIVYKSKLNKIYRYNDCKFKILSKNIKYE